MIGRPEREEAAPYYFTYIDRVVGDDPLAALETQLPKTLAVLEGISEAGSLHRYEPGKWSVRQLWNHVNDTERVFVSRALWFARGFESPLPGFDQDVAVAAAGADEVAWSSHLGDFRAVRGATLTFFRNLPADAWAKTGVASGNPFSVRALAFIVAGHSAHHEAILRERYLG